MISLFLDPKLFITIAVIFYITVTNSIYIQDIKAGISTAKYLQLYTKVTFLLLILIKLFIKPKFKSFFCFNLNVI